MSVTVGRAKLKTALRDLLVRWEETRVVWHDARAAHFEKRFIEPLEPQARSALAAMDRMAAVIAQAEHDCG
jgi:hypothetical protein